MNETTDQIESHIRHTRADLSANLNELEQKVKTAADWRHHYTKAPGTFLAIALGGGLLLAVATHSRRARSTVAASAPQSGPNPPRPKTGGQLDESISVIKSALIGLVANQAKSALARLLPGFEAQLPVTERPRSNPAGKSGARPAPSNGAENIG